MNIHQTVNKACEVAEKLARSRNEVLMVVPVTGKFAREAVIMTVKNWLDLCAELDFPVKFHSVFDKNGVKCDTTLNKDNI